MTKYWLVALLVLGGGVARAQQYPDVDYETPAGTPDAQYYGYVGVHPFPHEVGAGFCNQTAAHFHEYAPFDQYLFRESNGYFYFVGDVADFGYTQTTWAYQGNHPIAAHLGGGYCYIDWVHRHPFAPASAGFQHNGSAYVYVGGWDPLYYQRRDSYRGYYGNYYRNTYYGNRYYVNRPSHAYRPSLTVGAPGVYRPGVTVQSPGGFSVTVGGGRQGYGRPGYVAPAPGHVAPAPVYVAPPRPGVYVTPPHPAPVYVAPPRPSYVAPAPVYVAPPRPGVYVSPPSRPGVYVAPPRPSYAPAPGVRVVAPPGRHH